MTDLIKRSKKKKKVAIKNSLSSRGRIDEHSENYNKKTEDIKSTK